ncbi:MAG TPA: efflux RND transporter periplasmic adaptor subunit [Thermoanaerobaculia bacterium]|nr:efflux RND transporter periplasmic adaptor subunit [Thermoanaerobaculia bacterium]
MKRLAAHLLLAAVVFLGLGSAACSNDSQADPARPEGEAAAGAEAAPEDAAVPVEVVALATGPIEQVLRYSTNLEAEDEVAVYSQAARRVVALNVEEGAEVSRGQVLLRLQDDEQRNRLARATAELDRARREYERQKRLFANQLISEQAFNDATHQIEQLELAEADARRELSYTTVVAPISGTITRRLVGLGDHVTPNQHLFDLVDFDSIVARVYVPEKELPLLADGLSARIAAPSLARTWSGRVERLSPVVDPQSGTVKVTVAIPRQEGLRPGMYVDVQLVTDVREDALLVPKRALVYDRDQVFVYRMGEDRKVERIYLEAELEDERFLLPAGDRLAAGDKVVIAGQAALKPGALVRLAGERPEKAEAVAAEAGGAKGEARGR